MSDNKKIKTSIEFESVLYKEFQELAKEQRRTTVAQFHYEMHKAVSENNAKKSVVSFTHAAAVPPGKKDTRGKKSSG